MPVYRIKTRRIVIREGQRDFVTRPYVSMVVELPAKPPFKHGVRVKRVG